MIGLLQQCVVWHEVWVHLVVQVMGLLLAGAKEFSIALRKDKGREMSYVQ